MNLELQQELLRRYPKIFRKPERRPAPAIVLAETPDTPGTYSENEADHDPGTDAALPHLERPGWTVFDKRGFECGDGWFAIVDRLARVFETEIDAMIASGTSKPRWPRIRQCKEKLGSLRFYVSFPGGIPDQVRQHLLAAEADSRRICECCGKQNSENEEAPWISMCEGCYQSAQCKKSGIDLMGLQSIHWNGIQLAELLNSRQD